MVVITLNQLKKKIKKHGNKRVAKDALEEFSEILQARTEIICGEAKKLSEHADRKTVNKKDVKLASKKIIKK